MSNFIDRLTEYTGSAVYPMHMPGHKRRSLDFENDDAIARIRSLDITEIKGFDNLHNPVGLILEMQQRAADIFDAKKTCILVNGSTCGVMAAISACVRRGGKLLMARNSHKCAYNAAYLGALNTAYLYPRINKTLALNGGIAPWDVQKALDEDPDIEAVFITSPTYEGVISDIKAIADIVHEKDIPLIVDEAHGAHLGLYGPLTQKYGMESAIKLGADIVIQSLHKTLPALTQTALVHYDPELIDEKRLKRYLSMYQSSSPSYILMAGVDRCLDILEKQRTELFEKYAERIESFYRVVKEENFANLHILMPEEITGNFAAKALDISKITIYVPQNGRDLYEEMRKNGIEPEMFDVDHVLCITGIMDTAEGFDKLISVLRDYDKKTEKPGDITEKTDVVWPKPRAVMNMAQAVDMESVQQPSKWDKDYVCQDFVMAYPPGIPLIVPGEVFDQDVLEAIDRLRDGGVQLIYS
ncbi:MAG: aminotransferase class V-fold PLP-dependent enzyme [Lachnospiraceae bacterium]|nr:aminotransferase class V-fold PLP-dependent enzyme [Lachnospiraceae bacterium]